MGLLTKTTLTLFLTFGTLLSANFIPEKDTCYPFIRQWIDSTDPIPNELNKKFVNIASYNILSEHVSRKKTNRPERQWLSRRKYVATNIVKSNADVIGLQEVSVKMYKDLVKLLPDYKIVATVPSTGKDINEHSQEDYTGYINAIAFKKDTVDLIQDSCFWHSNTPDVVSLHEDWGFSHPKTTAYALFFHKETQKYFYFFTTHYSSKSPSARMLSGFLEPLMITAISMNIPWFAVGDRNAYEDVNGHDWYAEYHDITHELYNILGKNIRLADFRDSTLLGHFGPANTFGGLEFNNEHTKLIDNHTFKANALDVGFYDNNLAQAIFSYTLHGEYNPETKELYNSSGLTNPKLCNFASDHFLVGAVFELH